MRKSSVYKVLGTLLVTLGLTASVAVAHAQRGSIGGYVETYSGATTDESTLACEEQGYHQYTFSISDEDTGTSGYDGYYSVISYFRIHLEEDFVENVDMDNLICSTPFTDSDGTYIDCDGGSHTKTSGGVNLKTSASLTDNGDGTYTITWTYSDPDSTDSTPSTKPWMTTISGYDDYFSASVSFYGNDDVEDDDTASTSAEIFRHIYGVTVNGDGSWTYTDIADNSSINFDNDTWYDDGDTAVSYFEGCETACAALNLTSPTEITVDDVDDIITLEIEAYDEDSADWEGTYEYSSDGTCLFARSYIGATLQSGSNPLETSNETAYAYNCTAGETISIEEVDYPSACNASITIDDACADLEITSPTELTAEHFDADLGNFWVEIDITATAASSGTWNGTYQFSSDNASGWFSDSTWGLIFGGDNPHETTATTVYYFGGSPGDTISVVEVDYPDACSASITGEELACANLTVSPSSISLDALDEVTELTITTTDQLGDTWTGSYTLSSSDGGCLFSESQTDAEAGGGSNPLSTTQTTVYVHSCNEGETISIVEDDYPEVCNAQIEMVEEELACTNLEITSPETLAGSEDDNGIITITIESTDQNGDPWVGTYQYGTDDSSCLFTVNYDEALSGAGDTTLSTTETTVYAHSCSETAVLTVLEEDYPEACNSSLGADETEDACVGLTISPEASTASGDVTIVYTITPDPSDWAGPWTWTTSNANGIFTAENGTVTGNSITTTDLSVEYQGSEGDTITVTEATDYGDVCNATATITGEEPGGGGGGSSGGGGGGSSTSGGGSGGAGGSNTYCGNGVIEYPNDYGTYEECEPTGESTDDNPYGDICSNVCQIENVCTSLEISDLEDDTVEEGQVLTFTYQAYDYYGDTWDEDSYSWTTTDSDGEFSDGTDSGNNLDTDVNTIEYTVGSDTEASLTIQVGESEACVANFDLEDSGADDTFEKFVYTYNFGFYQVDNTVINGNSFGSYGHDFDYAFYTLAYTPDSAGRVDDVTITDTIATDIEGVDKDGEASPDSKIELYTATSGDFEPVRCWVDGNTETGENCYYETDGNYRTFSVKYEDGTDIEACDTETGETDEEGNALTIEDEGTTCYDGTISLTSGLDLLNLDNSATNDDGTPMPIAIRYLGQVDNGSFDCNDESADCPVLGFTNTAEVDGGRLSDSTDVTIICPFLLTRNAGDVWLGGELDEGFDLSCYYDSERNSDGLVFKQVDSWTNATCSSGSNNGLIERFSSYICEVLVDVKTVTQWNIEQVRMAQEMQINAITRHTDNLEALVSTGSRITNFDELQEAYGITRNNTSQNVYKISGSDLHFDLEADGMSKVPGGSYTFIVEDGDLFIDSNIEYEETDFNSLTNLNDVPSIAFVVLGGDIYISNQVDKMVGIYYVESVDGVGGNFDGDWTDPFTPLVIEGSFYGNIDPLLEQRTFSGPAHYNHGNVVIYYSENAVLNPPPGINEFVDLELQEAVR